MLGDGEGENAQWLDPKPRNFTLGVFKCRSTTTGTLPADPDLFDTIGRGLDRSNMPRPGIAFINQQRADRRPSKTLFRSLADRKAWNAD